MATDTSLIQALNDFPETPYKNSEQGLAIRMRWIHAQCFQIEFPDGQVLMTDPYFPQNPRAWKRDNTPLLDLDEIGRVDYITVNHSHFDHVDNIPDVYVKNNPVVICDRIFARELSKVYKVPEYNIFPFVPGQDYHFENFMLSTVIGRHNDLGSVCDMVGERFAHLNREYLGQLNSYGCIFNTSFLFTLSNGFRIAFAAGTDVAGMANAWRDKRPTLLLRQRLVYAKPEEYADDCLTLGGQLCVPMHHDASYDWNADMNAYAFKVNQIFAHKGSMMRMFNPERLKWYNLSLQISLGEDMGN